MAMSKEKPAPRVSCPACRKETPWSRDNPWRPFCSERCRLIDLGEWLDEGYRINEPQESGAPFPPADDQ